MDLENATKGEIESLQAELKAMQAFLYEISVVPTDQLSELDKLLARDARELSYEMEDTMDTFMLHNEIRDYRRIMSNHFKKLTFRILGLSAPTKIDTKIRYFKSRLETLADRNSRYRAFSEIDYQGISNDDPRVPALYTRTADLVGIDETRDELIKILMQTNELSEQQGKILSIVGSGGLGKTTLALQLYKQLGAQFECCAFVSSSRNPDMKKLFRDLLYQLDKKHYGDMYDYEMRLADELRGFLQNKRYFIVIDDIWDISGWELVRHALPDNKAGYRIITTTRILDIAERIGGAYIMKPLSLQNSRILLCRRIFGDEDEANLDEEVAEVSHKILKRCAGLPLAVITIASALARKGRNKMDWYNVYNSIGSGLEYNQDVENMRKILSLSYDDLPSYLKTCLLYFSMFPEDYEIDKDLLIKMLIAEGLIQCGNERQSMFHLGESYLNELANRRMIQPVYGWNSAKTRYYRTHDMLLDLIRYLSNEENFVTILNDLYHTSPSQNVRRLSIQYSNQYFARPEATTTSMQQVRSVALFPSVVSLMPPLSSFRVVRVLYLENSCLSEGYSLECLENLFHLRYLKLRDPGLAQLPGEIGNLRFLQTLDVRGTGISSLPSTVVQLKHLMFLHIESWTKVPRGIGNLKSLQELSTLGIDDSTDFIEELSCLAELRVLGIDCHTGWNVNSSKKCQLEFLNRLQKIESLYISVFGECNLDAWETPHHLRRLELSGCWSSTISTWMKQPLLLQGLSFVSIEMRNLCQDDLDLLGMLPSLSSLDLEVDHKDLEILGILVIGACSFPSLVHCVLRGSIGPVEFQQGAMPRLRTLFLTFPVRETREIADCNDGFDLGLGNLQSLRDVTISFLYGGATEEDSAKAEAALRHAVEIHTNYPTLQIR